MKISRLFRPQDPRFWLLIALNTVSGCITWILQYRQIPFWLQMVLAVFAIINCALGVWLARDLMRD